MSENPSTPPKPTVVTDPYGSGATFGWSRGGVDVVPQPGDPDFAAYNAALQTWLAGRYQTYLQSTQYQHDQAMQNPDIASGRIPAVGYVAQGPNAWFIPTGSKVTSVTPTEGGGYQVGYTQPVSPQHVVVQGPGYGFEGTVYAPNAQIAGQMALVGYRNQTAGLNTSPTVIGGYVSSVLGGKVVVQAGNPVQNEFWVKQGLPQYAGYSVPSLTAQQQSEGFYIKEITSGGVAPNITVANKVWETFWSQQGYPQFSNIKPPELQQGEYIFNAKLESGKLSYGVGNPTWEQQWQTLGVTDISLIRGYTPPVNELGAGAYVKDLTKTESGLSFRLSTPEIDQQLAQLNADASKWTSAGFSEYAGKYFFPSLPEGASIQGITKTDTGLDVSYNVPSPISGAISEVNIPEGYDPIYAAQLNSMRSAFNAYKTSFPTQTQNNPNANITVPYTVDEILAQNLKFSQALVKGIEHPELIGVAGSGAISIEQYSEAMQIQQANYALATGYKGGASPKYVSVPNMGLPSDPASTIYIAGDNGSLYLRSDYKVAAQTINELQTTYTFAPVNQSNLNIIQPPTPNIAGFSFGNGISGTEFNLSGLFGSQPIVNTSAKRTMALEALTVVVAPAIGGSQILVGEGIGAGLAQVPNVVKAAMGQKVTFQDVTQAGLEGAAVGGVFSLGGSTIITAVGATGKGLIPTLSRAGINAALGASTSAIIEKATTGQVTVENVALGAGLGVAFSLGGDVLVPRAQSSIRVSPIGEYSQARLNASYMNAAEQFVPWKPALSEKLFMRVLGQTPAKPINIVAAGTDVDVGLLNAGFVKPSEAPMTATERLVAQRGLGVKETNLTTEELAFKNPTVETIENIQSRGPEGYVRMPESKEGMIRSTLGTMGKEPMPTDYLEPFGLETKATISPELTPEQIKVANLYLKATSDMPVDYAAGFGTEKAWSTPAKPLPPLKTSELPNPVSQTFTDMVWDLTLQPGSSSLALEKFSGISAGSKSTPQTFSGGAFLGLTTKPLGTDNELKMLTRETQPSSAQQNVANTPTLTAIKTSIPTRLNDTALLTPLENNPVEVKATDNPFLQSASPYPIQKKRSTPTEDILIVYSEPPNSPIGGLSEEQLLIPVPAQPTRQAPQQIIFNIQTQKPKKEDNVGAALVNVPSQSPYIVPVEGLYPLSGVASKVGLNPAAATTPFSSVDTQVVAVQKATLASALDMATIQEVTPTQISRVTELQKQRFGFPQPTVTNLRLDIPFPTNDFNRQLPKIPRGKRGGIGSMLRIHPIAEPSALLKKPKAPSPKRRTKK